VVVITSLSLDVNVFGIGEKNACRVFFGNLMGNVHFKRPEEECGHIVFNGGPWLCQSVGSSRSAALILSVAVHSFELFSDFRRFHKSAKRDH
jgi:hypothetical protein